MPCPFLIFCLSRVIWTANFGGDLAGFLWTSTSQSVAASKQASRPMLSVSPKSGVEKGSLRKGSFIFRCYVIFPGWSAIQKIEPL